MQHKHRSGRFRKVQRKTPGSRNVQHYEERKSKLPRCASCGVTLKGIPRLSASKGRHLGKTKKRPERPFGGMLCSACARRRLIQKARA
jgi:large subunit ribosomal protein L34e